LKKASDEESEFASRHGFIENTRDNRPAQDRSYRLVAGTSFLFSRPELAGAFDVLVYDEAGQIALADGLAMGMAAENLVFLGDPQQLSQVTQGAHPPGASASVLEHLLGEAAIVSPECGLFLDRSWRMHPEVCAFVSEISYEGRLRAVDECAKQLLDVHPYGAAGPRFLPVEHAGNRQRSGKEAERIRGAYESLLGARFVDRRDVARDLTVQDLLVVTPHNAQVSLLAEVLPAEARIGTVDKFQGQEAPVVLFSMASSSAEDVPRGLEFLFHRNRLNVAISRAQCMALVVASPTLLTVRCRTVEQLRLVSAPCRFVELAREV
jgi:uncharacterized protein